MLLPVPLNGKVEQSRRGAMAFGGVTLTTQPLLGLISLAGLSY